MKVCTQNKSGRAHRVPGTFQPIPLDLLGCHSVFLSQGVMNLHLPDVRYQQSQLFMKNPLLNIEIYHWTKLNFSFYTYHMIMLTSRMTISLRQSKKSVMGLAFSPMLPMMIPNAQQKAIIPGTDTMSSSALYNELDLGSEGAKTVFKGRCLNESRFSGCISLKFSVK